MADSKAPLNSQKVAAIPNPKYIEPSPRRVRVLFNKKFVADTTAAKLVWEHPYYPNYYLPASDVQTKYLEILEKSEDGEAHVCKLIVGNRSANKVLWLDKGELNGLIRFQFSEMDSWFEEDTEIYVHPKDPYKRVDILPSTRHIVIKLNDTVIAQSSAPLLLYETGLAIRYYLPKTSVNFELLEPSKSVTSCPYKGEAHYYSIVLDGKEYKDYVWWYQYPTSESIAIAGRVCFYNEKVDIYIDGVKEKKAKIPLV